MLITNKGYIGIAKQTGKGSAAATSDIFIKYLDESFKTERNTTPLREGGDGEMVVTQILNVHKEKFQFKVIARPRIAAYLFAWILGEDTKSGGADPYTHVLTRSVGGRCWLTIRRKLDTNVIQKLTDCKIEKITFEGEAGKECIFTVDGIGLSSAIESSEETATYETMRPFVFYHGHGRFKVESAATSNIKKFSVQYGIKSQEGMQTDNFLIEDLPDLMIDGDVALDLYASDTTFWKKANYNNTAAPVETVYSGAFELDLRQTETATDDRGIKIEVGKFFWNPVDLGLKGAAEVMTNTIAGVMAKPAAGEMFQVTCKNDISADLANAGS